MQPYIAVPTNSNISVAKLPPTTRRINFPYLDSSRIPRIVVNHSAVAARMPVNPFQNRTIALLIVIFFVSMFMIFTEKNDKTTKGSLNLKRLKAGWDEEYLSKLLEGSAI